VERSRAAPRPSPSSELSDLLKPTEVAKLLAVSRSWLYAAAADGRIPSVRLGGPEGPLRFVQSDLTEWLAGQPHAR
jgi:excisionase family DNA binding protein